MVGLLIAVLLAASVPLASPAGAQEVGTDLQPRARIVQVEPIIAPDGELWVRLHFEEPWGDEPPFDLFSMWFGIGTATLDAQSWAGWEWHDGVSTPFESSATRGESGAYALDDGTVVLATGLFPDGEAVGMSVLMASWLSESDTERQADRFDLSFSPEEYQQGDPLSLFGTPTHNLITNTPIGQTAPSTSSTPPSAPASTSSTPAPTSGQESTSSSPPAPTSSEASTAPGDDTTSAPAPSTSGGGGGVPVWVWFLGIFLLFVAWMIYVYFSTRLAGSGPDRCRPERDAVARARRALADAQEDEETARGARDRAEADLAEAEFSRKGNRQEIVEQATRARDEARLALDRAVNDTALAREELAAAEAALAECERRAASTPGTTSDPPPSGPSTPPDADGTATPPEPDCCPSGNWIGVNAYSGGMGVVAGAEWGLIYLVCIDDPSRTAWVSWKGVRLGLGLGGEISGGLFLVIGGPQHPNELERSVEGVLSGFDGDLSLGASWSKLLKATVKGGRHAGKLGTALQQIRDASKALNKARKAGNIEEATRISAKNADVLKQLVRDGTAGQLADTLGEAAIKSGASGAQAGGTGVNIPLGVGLQVGLWQLFAVEAMMQSWDGCERCGTY